VVSLCLFLGGVLACERRAPSLIGKWQSASGESFEFFGDGTVRMQAEVGPAGGGQTFSGAYRLLEGDRLTLEMTAGGVVVKEIFAYKLSGDALTLKNEAKGQVIAYRRVAATAAASSGLAKQLSEGARQQPAPPPPPPVEPQRGMGSFSLEEETPAPAPPEPRHARPAPPATPRPPVAWGGRWSWTSQRLVQPDDLWSLSLLELELMRNEIYARHGWVFNRRDLRDYFSRQPWYSPKGELANREQVNRWAQSELTTIEKKNIQTIVSREKALKR